MQQFAILSGKGLNIVDLTLIFKLKPFLFWSTVRDILEMSEVMKWGSYVEQTFLGAKIQT